MTDPIVLKVLARPLARLGSGLIRKKAIAAVAGFSEDVAFALEQHFLVKVAGIFVRQTSTQSPLATFVEAPSTRPLFFERRDPEGPARYDRVGSARQHLANVLFARAILQQHGLLTAANSEALAAGGGAPTIVVASTIYAEPSSRWPMPIEVGPAPSVPPDSKLLLRGLPPGATLSDGRRTPAGVRVVPVAGLANLEVQVPAAASGRLDLTLALVGRDDASLAEGHTALSINAPTVVTAGAPAAEARPHEETEAEADRGDLPLNAARASTAAETSKASSILARSRTDAPSPSFIGAGGAGSVAVAGDTWRNAVGSAIRGGDRARPAQQPTSEGVDRCGRATAGCHKDDRTGRERSC